MEPLQMFYDGGHFHFVFPVRDRFMVQDSLPFRGKKKKKKPSQVRFLIWKHTHGLEFICVNSLHCLYVNLTCSAPTQRSAVPRVCEWSCWEELKRWINVWLPRGTGCTSWLVVNLLLKLEEREGGLLGEDLLEESLVCGETTGLE